VGPMSTSARARAWSVSTASSTTSKSRPPPGGATKQKTQPPWVGSSEPLEVSPLRPLPPGRFERKEPGRSPGSRIALLSAPSHPAFQDSGIVRISSPITVAGQQRARPASAGHHRFPRRFLGEAPDSQTCLLTYWLGSTLPSFAWLAARLRGS
jgi:hypothetical protein